MMYDLSCSWYQTVSDCIRLYQTESDCIRLYQTVYQTVPGQTDFCALDMAIVGVAGTAMLEMRQQKCSGVDPLAAMRGSTDFPFHHPHHLQQPQITLGKTHISNSQTRLKPHFFPRKMVESTALVGSPHVPVNV